MDRIMQRQTHLSRSLLSSERTFATQDDTAAGEEKLSRNARTSRPTERKTSSPPAHGSTCAGPCLQRQSCLRMEYWQKLPISASVFLKKSNSIKVLNDISIS